MTVHETTTALSPAAVIARAEAYFAEVRGPHAVTVVRRGATFIGLHMEVGEMVIGAVQGDGETRVRGSASRAGGWVARFLTTLPPRGAADTVEHRLRRAA